jgi:hypothetical protein
LVVQVGVAVVVALQVVQVVLVFMQVEVALGEMPVVPILLVEPVEPERFQVAAAELATAHFAVAAVVAVAVIFQREAMAVRQ